MTEKKMKFKDEVQLDQYGHTWTRYMHNWTPLKLDTHSIEYSTGLKDVDGNEIFQGDIIEGLLTTAWGHDVIRCEVVWNETKLKFESRCYMPHKPSRYWTHKIKFSNDVKVIGNIHENIDLLNNCVGILQA